MSDGAHRKPRDEPSDRHVYTFVWFMPDALRFLHRAAERYQQSLQSELDRLEEDPDWQAIFEERDFQDLEIQRHYNRAGRTAAWATENLESDKAPYHIHVTLSHAEARWLKSLGLDYLRHLESRRDEMAAIEGATQATIETIDSKLARFREILRGGIFKHASPIPLLASEAADEVPMTEEAVRNKGVSSPRRQPQVLTSIEILDPELRERCLPDYNRLVEEGKDEEFDRVVREATVLLETRIRSLASVPDELTGQRLVTAVFRPEAPILSLSNVPAERSAGMALFQGVFGLIRNVYHHRLVPVDGRRVLQVLGLIDYLLHLLDNAATSESPADRSRNGSESGADASESSDPRTTSNDD